MYFFMSQIDEPPKNKTQRFILNVRQPCCDSMAKARQLLLAVFITTSCHNINSTITRLLVVASIASL